MQKLRKYSLIISIILYCLSLTQDAFYIDKNDHDAWSSLPALILGWLGILFGSGAAFTWLANPVLFLSWFFLFNNIKSALLTSILASIIAASFLLFHEIISDEAGNYSKITHYGAGYWLWLISCLITLLGTVKLYSSAKSNMRQT